jgi:hypothetical protein
MHFNQPYGMPERPLGTYQDQAATGSLRGPIACASIGFAAAMVPALSKMDLQRAAA